MTPGSSPEVLPCPPEALAEALTILYRQAPEALRPRLVADAVQEARRGTMDFSGLWIGRRRGRVVGALLSQRLAGRAAAVWAPEVAVSWGRSALAVGLVRAALADLRDTGVRIAQALIDAASPRRAADDLTNAGMPRVTALAYLARDTAPPLEPPPGVPPMQWRGFGPETEPEFREVLEASYLGSLDMPELEGVRGLDDILAGHRAGGRFRPDLWRIGRLPGEPGAAALALLGVLPERDAWEVAYLGLTPPARGRGLGRAAMAHALDLARGQAPRLELAVDARNLPAARLYGSCGFVPFDRRAVHLAVFGGPTP